ncbi:protein EARLY FLOWERING 4-like [Pistacia vera]|uniref:protein EARLY FLOWERING 4-like n=1 Tax=Pistacia vera TaxID=55513 RepID=UPI0012633F28|nr:protein EARLY FLOWERING 4-like [Pistacia vera]
MTSRGSASSAVVSTMETTTSNTFSKKRNHHHTNTTTTQEEGHDSEVWSTFNHSFKQVQSVLDRNRVLIQQVNDNHQSKVPDNMAKNVALIQELNGNISKVVSLYSDLSSNFSTTFQYQRNKNSDGERDSGED